MRAGAARAYAAEDADDEHDDEVHGGSDATDVVPDPTVLIHKTV